MPLKGGREIKVGLIILTAFAVLAAGIFLIGEKNNLFKSKNQYFIEFGSVSGLRPGNPVQLNGVDVGTVDRVVLSEDPREEHIHVWITIDEQYAGRIRGLADPRRARAAAGTPAESGSVARIKTLGLLGDKYIELTAGAPELPVIPDRGEIPAAQPTNVDALLASGESVMDNVVEISASLSTILGRMERGEGLLGELTTNSESGRRLRESVLGTTESMQRIADKIEAGEGPIGRLLNDRAMADQLSRSLDRFETVLVQVQSGPGLIPGLINDPSMKAQVQDTLATLNGVARDLRAFTDDLETSDALLPRLVNDEEYGREVTGQLQAIVDRLHRASVMLTEGQGSAAKLLNDPQVYEAVNDILIGVNESRVLRWLIRNRQKKGLERRYEDTKQQMEEQGVAPPPLDAGPDATGETPPPEAEAIQPPLAPPAEPPSETETPQPAETPRPPRG